MPMTRVVCQACGAKLEVGEGLRYVSCNECAAGLEVVREASVTYTQQLLGEDGEAEDLRVLELQNELERFDHDWEQAQELFKMSYSTRLGYTVRHHRTIPTLWTSAAVMGIGVSFAIPFFSIGGWVWGVMPLLIGFVGSAGLYIKAVDYRRAKVTMMAERAKLEMALKAAKRRAGSCRRPRHRRPRAPLNRATR